MAFNRKLSMGTPQRNSLGPNPRILNRLYHELPEELEEEGCILLHAVM